ncbi:MAG: helix-turn-helix domain-containing protein [Balneolaceae bacterium]|nr:helix-turn-helix domain-containing protein [Balneolaceae bacterium]
MGNGNRGKTSALYVWNGMMVFWGASFDTDPHSHKNTLQLVFDIDKEFKLRDHSTEWARYSAAIIKASHIHQLDSNGSIQLFIYLDKESTYAQKLTNKYLLDRPFRELPNSDIREFSNEFFKRLVATENCGKLFRKCMMILRHLINREQTINIDKRIQKAISFITEAPVKQFKVEDVANHVSLSESHLRHLFKEQVGQPIQNFILWMRVVDSLNLVLEGKQLTQTAHEVGFWDSSHMNRSYKKLLGVSPGSIKKHEDDYRIITCDRDNFYTFKTEILQNWNSETPLKIVDELDQIKNE